MIVVQQLKEQNRPPICNQVTRNVGHNLSHSSYSIATVETREPSVQFMLGTSMCF
jgi:hypothetical protein